MNAKTFCTLLLISFGIASSRAQGQETCDSISYQLNELVVKAKQPATKLVGSTLVSTIAGTKLADIGNALDVLAQLPMIKVEENDVSVIGKNKVEIFIDGRPIHDRHELQRLLSSNLKKVELLLAPGAAYSSTTDAVLKITTRRNFITGFSLDNQLSLQRRRKWSVSDYLGSSYHAGNREIFVNATIDRSDKLVKGTTTDALVYEGKKTIVGSKQHNSYPTTAATIKAGFNYTKDAQSFGAYYKYNPECGDFSNNGSEWLDDDTPLLRHIGKRVRSGSHLVSLYYERSFADKYRLHLDGDFTHSKADNNVATTYSDTTPPDVNSSDIRKSTLWAGKLYLDFPLCGGEFTVGTQDSYTHTSLDYHMSTPQISGYLPSSLSDARQTAAALFASWARNSGKLSMTIGARYEYVDYDFEVNGHHDGNVSRRSHLLTPDIAFGYIFNDNAQISLNYKMATVKPPYSQLTGALNYVGLHEIEGGNTALRDEKMHDVQLFGMWNGFMLQADVTRSFDTYAFVKQLYPVSNLQLLLHPVNIDVSALSVYLIWYKDIGCWSPNITTGMYKQWLRLGDTHYNKPIFSYYFDNTFSLPHGWLLTTNMSGQTQGDMHTNRFGTTWFTMDASVGKTLLGKALTIKLSATDIFNTANNNWTMNTCGITVDKRQSYDRRGISLNMIYKLRPYRSKYKGAAAAEGELRRL